MHQYGLAVLNEALNDINLNVNSPAGTAFSNLRKHKIHVSAIVADDILLEFCGGMESDGGRIASAMPGVLGRLDSEIKSRMSKVKTQCLNSTTNGTQ